MSSEFFRESVLVLSISVKQSKIFLQRENNNLMYKPSYIQSVMLLSRPLLKYKYIIIQAYTATIEHQIYKILYKHKRIHKKVLIK